MTNTVKRNFCYLLLHRILKMDIIILSSIHISSPRFGTHKKIKLTFRTECRSTSTSKAFSNYKDYQKSKGSFISKTSGYKIGRKIDVSVKIPAPGGVSIGASRTIKPLTKQEFSNSDSSGEVRQFFDSGYGMILTANAICFTATMRLTKNSLPPFTTAFRNALKKLEQVDECLDS